jgi:amino acid transporter
MTNRRAVDEDSGTTDRWRLSVFHLVGLAAGGVLGSGWITAALDVHSKVGAKAWLVWPLGGLLMFIIAWVMVELGREAPRTGGLIFLPLQSSGPLVATVVAAGLWIFYVINLVSETIMMAYGFGHHARTILFSSAGSGLPSSPLTRWGWLTVLGLMIVISALNLLLPKIFLRINSWITVVKVVIILATVILLLGYFHVTKTVPAADCKYSPPKGSDGGWSSVLPSVVGSGVIYAYVGFQGPLDFAGNIRRSPGRWWFGARRRGVDDRALGRSWEVDRLSWAVLGTVVGSFLLYLALQVVFDRDCGGLTDQMFPFTQIARHGLHGQLRHFVWALQIGVVLAPMGAGMVFAHALTREVAALGRAHLTHRGLQTARQATVGRHHGIYWLVLVVDVFVGVAVLALAHGNRHTLVSVTGVLALIVYAMPGVVLVAQADRFAKRSVRRHTVRSVMARTSFALIGLILHMTGWHDLWRGLATLGAGSAVLLGLPLVSRRWPAFARFYDAKAHAALLFPRWRREPAVWAVLTLIGYLVALSLLTLGRFISPSSAHTTHRVLDGLAVVIALLAFEFLVRTSKRFATTADETARRPITVAR